MSSKTSTTSPLNTPIEKEFMTMKEAITYIEKKGFVPANGKIKFAGEMPSIRYLGLEKIKIITNVFVNPKGGVTSFSDENVYCSNIQTAINAGYSILTRKDVNVEIHELGMAINKGLPEKSDTKLSREKIFKTLDEVKVDILNDENPYIYEVSVLPKKKKNKFENEEEQYHKMKFKFRTSPVNGNKIEKKNKTVGKKKKKSVLDQEKKIDFGNICTVEDVEDLHTELINKGNMDDYDEDKITPLNIDEKDENGVSWNDDLVRWLGYGSMSKLFIIFEISQIMVMNIANTNYIRPVLKIDTMFVQKVIRSSNTRGYMAKFLKNISFKTNTSSNKIKKPEVKFHTLPKKNKTVAPVTVKTLKTSNKTQKTPVPQKKEKKKKEKEPVEDEINEEEEVDESNEVVKNEDISDDSENEKDE